MGTIDECTWVPPRKTIDWRGNQVTEKEGIALKYLFDDMGNYFGQPDGEPRVIFNIKSFDKKSDDETDGGGGSSNHFSADKAVWRGSLEFNYKMNHKNRDTSLNLDYMSMDVCIDLKPKKQLNFGGHDMSEYCRTWVYVYAPRYTIETVLRHFEAGTASKVSSKGLVLDEEQNIVHFEAKLLVKPQPQHGFWIPNEDDSKQFTRLGTVHEVSQDPAYQLLFRCIGIFAVTAEVARSSSSKPSDSAVSGKEEARLIFTLVSTRTEGIVNNIAPVVYNPRRCTKCNTSDNPEWWH
jgi:hypothetical protein